MMDPRSVASSASSSVTGSADAVIDATDDPELTETPRLPVRTLPIQERYWVSGGSSMP
jgi:hypothetical protein